MLFIMTPSTSRSNTFILLFYLLFPFAHMSCPIQCPGRKVEDCKCTSPCYRELRQGIQTCQRCTEMCSARKNQIEVRPCTREMNRLCNCKPGYYCRKSYNYGTYCHEPCVRCEPGTFSSKPSLDPVCKPHKDCAQLGMETLKKGTETQDSECAFVTSTMAASSSPSSNINSIYTNTTSTLRTVKNIRSLVAESTATPDRESVNATTKMAPTASSNFTTVYTHTASTLRTVKEIVTRGSSVEGSTATPDSQSVNATTKMTASPTASSHFNTVYTHTASTLRTVKEIVTRGSSVEGSTATPDRESVNATTKMAASPTASSHFNTVYTHTASTLRTEGTPLSIDQEKSESHWPLLLILLLLLLFMAGFCMLMKGKTLKTLCFGLIKGEHEERLHWRKRAGEHQILSNSQSNVLIDHNMKTEIPLGSDVREVKGQSMDMTPQSGVVQQVTVEHNGRGENVSNTVGSIYIYSPGMVILGSNSGDKKEEVGVCEEARPLIGAPQQESNPPSQEVKIRLSAQEEAEEELSLSFPVPATGK